jgi:hypothetical protein
MEHIIGEVLRIKKKNSQISTLKRRIKRGQRLVRRHVKAGVSLADELIAERREAARREFYDNEKL